MGMSEMALRLEADRSFVNEAVELSVAHEKAYLERLRKNGSIDCVFIAAATDNPDLLGPKTYSQISLRWLRDLVNFTHELGYPIIFHPHGTFSSPSGEPLLNDTISTGIDGFQFAENNDPGTIKRFIDGRCSILGGTDVVPTLLSGTDDAIRSETQRYIDACEGASHVFMPSCSLHRGNQHRQGPPDDRHRKKVRPAHQRTRVNEAR